MIKAIIWAAVSTAPQANEDEKISLPQQEADGQALAMREGWRVLDVLRVPGHSRRYVDFRELMDDAGKEGIDAFRRLLDHWERRDFDILVVRDGDRFARTQALHAYITERTIDIGARIYSLSDGWVDLNNYRLWIAMGGYKAASEIDRLVKYHKQGNLKRLERGLPVSSSVIMSHRIERDASGKALRLVVDESKRALWDEVATLVLEGQGWVRFEAVLFRRFGRVNPNTNKPYTSTYFHRLLYNPTLWGNSAQHFNSDQWGSQHGPWAFDPTYPLPSGVTIHYNTHEPIYSGELAEQIKAELRRRSSMADTRKGVSYMFTGLIICARCNSRMVIAYDPPRNYYRCRPPSSYVKGPCGVPLIREDKVVAFVDRALREMLEAGTVEALGNRGDGVASRRIADTEHEIADIDNQIRKLIMGQATAPDSLTDFYIQEIQNAAERRDILRGNLEALRQTTAQIHHDQHRAFEEIREMSVEKFWQLPPKQINRLLFRLLGDLRLIGQDGDIRGFTEAPKYYNQLPR